MKLYDNIELHLGAFFFIYLAIDQLLWIFSLFLALAFTVGNKSMAVGSTEMLLHSIGSKFTVKNY